LKDKHSLSTRTGKHRTSTGNRSPNRNRTETKRNEKM